MKSFRTTLIFFGILALLGGYIYFFERGPVKKAEEKREKVFENFVADDIQEIRVENLGNSLTPAAPPIDIKKDEKDVWQILSPQKYQADENTLRVLLQSIGDLNPDAAITNISNLADYGLNSPTARCILTDKKGTSHTLIVGDKGVTGSDTYIKTSEKPAVYLIPAYTTDNIKKSVNDYRNRVLFKTDLVAAQKVEVVYGDKTLVLEKDAQNTWNIKSPIEEKADSSKIRDLLNSLNDMKVNEFVDEHPKDIKIYGLSKPRGKVTLWPSDKGSPKTVLIGRQKLKTTDDFVKMEGQDSVYQVGDAFVKPMDFKINNFRDKLVMQFAADVAKSLTIKSPRTNVTYQKDDKGIWTCPGRVKAQDEASNLISQLSETVIVDFASNTVNTGVENPSFEANVTLKDGTSRLYRFGRIDNGQVYLASDKSKDTYLVYINPVSQMESYYNSILTPIPIASPAPLPKK